MNHRNAIALVIVFALLNLVFLVKALKAQNAPTETGRAESTNLAGSTLKMEDTVLKANAIFVGEIIQEGIPDVSAPGRSAYSGVKVKVLQVLRGSVDAQVSVTLYTTYSSNEQPPKAGSTYIFLAHKNTEPGWDAYKVFKLLPATDENIAKVKQLIAVGPAPK